MSDENQHSRLSFSNRYRWRICAGAPKACEGLPDKPSAASEEGTLAHEVAEHYTRKIFNLPDLQRQNVMSDDPDMHRHGQAYAEMLLDEVRGHEVKVATEAKVDSKHLHRDLYGTADTVIYVPVERRVIVADYKYGMNPVNIGDVHNPNPQLEAYAISALNRIRGEVDTVDLIVYQPRGHSGAGVQPLTLNADILRGEASQRLKAEAEATDDPNAPLVPGAHCQHCPAAKNLRCSAAKAARDKVARLALGLATPADIDDGDLADLYRAKKLLTVQMDEIEAELRRRVAANPNFGHGLEYKPRKGNLQWYADQQDVIADLIRLDMLALLRPVTVNEAKKSLPPDLFDALTKRGDATYALIDKQGDPTRALESMLLKNPFETGSTPTDVV